MTIPKTTISRVALGVVPILRIQMSIFNGSLEKKNLKRCGGYFIVDLVITANVIIPRGILLRYV
jgi:hypothetical protein